MSQYQHRFTVFTPTYNRAYTIHLVFNSLMKQSYKSFEWLIVDDGSTDNTQKIVEEFQQKAWFPIRYIQQRNGGKHRAINRGVKEARGEFFLIFDSDDWCTDNALERFDFHWEQIPKKDKDVFASIASLCQYANGDIIGDRFPSDVFDSDFNTMFYSYGIKGDKWLVVKTDIVKKFPFPEFEGENFIAEGSVWNQIGKNYKTRFINEALEFMEYLDDGLSSKTRQLRRDNCLGTVYTYSHQFFLEIPFKMKIKALINCIRFSVFNKNAFYKCFKNIIKFINFSLSNSNKNERIK